VLQMLQMLEVRQVPVFLLLLPTAPNELACERGESNPHSLSATGS
jgi:hypothetical protein